MRSTMPRGELGRLSASGPGQPLPFVPANSRATAPPGRARRKGYRAQPARPTAGALVSRVCTGALSYRGPTKSALRGQTLCPLKRRILSNGADWHYT
jgi:hypothetical protein